MPYVPVPFTILADSGVQEAVDGSGPSAEVKFKVAWGDRYTFINRAVGTTSGGPGAIVRVIPLVYPPSPNLYAMAAGIQPLGKLSRDDDEGWVAYPYAIISVKFSVPTFSFDTSDPSGVPWTTTTFDLSGEFLTLPDSTFRFAGSAPLGVPAGRIIPQVAVSFKRHWVPYLPVAAMFNLLGKVNADPFHLGDFVCDSETLLFLGGPNQRTADTAGSVAQEVEYKMLYRPISWNKFLHPNGTSGFQYIADGNGDHVYGLGDFTTLP